MICLMKLRFALFGTRDPPTMTFHLTESVEYNPARRGEAFIYEDFRVPALLTYQNCLTFRIPIAKFNYHGPSVRKVFMFFSNVRFWCVNIQFFIEKYTQHFRTVFIWWGFRYSTRDSHIFSSIISVCFFYTLFEFFLWE